MPAYLTCSSSHSPHFKTMLDQSKQLSSLNPDNQIHRNSGSMEDIEFDFWGTRAAQYYEKFSDRCSNETEFQAQFEEDFGDDDDSPRLWEKNMSRNVRTESSPLLPHRHHYSNISPTSRLQAIAEGRKELMQMVHSMPESSYELSLKDIVDEQHVSQGEQEDKVIQETSFDFKADAEIKKQKRKKVKKNISKPGQVSRCGSMEKETFLIKMFIPTSLTWKTKIKARSGSKVSPRTSFDGSENHVDKEWWVKRILVPGEGKNSGRSSSSGSSSSINSNSSRICRHGKTNSFLGCWPLFCTTKRKSRRDRGCIF